MQRLQLSPDEKLTRKEYLKRKKKQSKILQPKSKFSYIIISVIVVLCAYVFTQFYVYSRSNSLKYTEDDNMAKQKVYQLYYVTEGYTYDPVYSLNSIHSDSFEDKSIYQNSGMHSIQIDEEYIYGMKGNGLYKLNKETNVIEMLVEKDVKKYSLSGDKIYYIDVNNKLFSVDIHTAEISDLKIDNASELLLDENNMYATIDEKTKKILVKYDLNGQNKKVLSDSCNISYIIQKDDKIYFVNKGDSNKLYIINKDGSGLSKIDDISSISDNGNITEIDGSNYMFVNDNNLYYINVDDSNTLWKINLGTKEKQKVISMSVQYLYIIEDTVFYKVKNEMGVYLYNAKTGFLSQVTKRKVKDFVVDKYVTIEEKDK